MAVYWNILEGNSGLAIIGDQIEDVFPKRIENGVPVLSYEVYAGVTCKHEGKIRRKGGPPAAC
jgi:hypothetical protein